MKALNFTDCVVRVDERGAWLSLLLENGDTLVARQFVLAKKDKLYTAELKEYREKRSLDANAYFWKLLGELSKALGEKEDDLYLGYVRDYGPYRDWPLEPDLAPTFREVWSRTGKGWPTEQLDYTPDGERVIIRAYYGSSTYNTKQMSRLIDAVVQDCKAVGVETLPPDKLALLKEGWGAQGD